MDWVDTSGNSCVFSKKSTISLIVVVDGVCNNGIMTTTKLLQSVLDKVSSLDKKVDEGFKSINKRMDEVEKNLTVRIDKIGIGLAELSDDSPTIEEFDELDGGVSKLENRVYKD